MSLCQIWLISTCAHFYICACVCVCVLYPVSCALIILPRVVAAQQIIHGPANQAKRQAGLACTGSLTENDPKCVCVSVLAFSHSASQTHWNCTSTLCCTSPNAYVCSQCVCIGQVLKCTKWDWIWNVSDVIQSVKPAKTEYCFRVWICCGFSLQWLIKPEYPENTHILIIAIYLYWIKPFFVESNYRTSNCICMACYTCILKMKWATHLVNPL